MGPGFFYEDAPQAEPPMLKVCIAGVTCTGWSQCGKRREFSDPSERQHAIFVAERLKRAEDLVDDIVFIECASTYKADEKLRALRSSHIILILRYGLERMGWPFRRCRTFVALLNKRTMAWCGPDNFEADFSARFDRARGCDGDMLLCAPESWRSTVGVREPRRCAAELHHGGAFEERAE